MPGIRNTAITDPDGSVGYEEYDIDTGELLRRVLEPYHRQPAAVRRRDEAREAVRDWFLLREVHAELTNGGQGYWDVIAPDADLPTGATAYAAALGFLETRRNKALSRAAAALDRWRTA